MMARENYGCEGKFAHAEAHGDETGNWCGRHGDGLSKLRLWVDEGEKMVKHKMFYELEEDRGGEGEECGVTGATKEKGAT
jgi:hypothetical protein